MAKVDKDYVKITYTRIVAAKQALYEANQALHLTLEYKAVKDAEHKLELAQDCLAGLLTIMNQKVF
jgi:hypothetical protein